MSKYALSCLVLTAGCVYGAFLAPELTTSLVQASRAGIGFFGTLFIVAMLIGRRIKFDPVLR
jgi:hypothetical protein